MNLLLDTCTCLWLATDPGQLSARATSLLINPANVLWLSTVSVWEIILKNRIGKLPLTSDVEQMVNAQVQTNGVRVLPLEQSHVLEGRTLPLHHHDPFDRLLVCQALAEGLTIVTPDQHIQQYAVPTDW
jgi:PIN domain nuclease of toxin-antitoxin system